MRLLLNKREVRPLDLQPGDVMKVTITCHVRAVDGSGGVVARYYDCGNGETYAYDQNGKKIPQGMRVPGVINIEDLFPVNPIADREVMEK